MKIPDSSGLKIPDSSGLLPAFVPEQILIRNSMPMKIALLVLFTYGSLSAQRVDAAVAADAGATNERDGFRAASTGHRTEP
jgi:hypothetical protein